MHVSNADDYQYLTISKNYEDSRLLMATAVHYYAQFNLTAIDSSLILNKIDEEIGYKFPDTTVEKAVITRPVHYRRPDIGGAGGDYIGTMTLYVWMNSTKS